MRKARYGVALVGFCFLLSMLALAYGPDLPARKRPSAVRRAAPLSERLAEGYRAVALEVDARSAPGGMLDPGSCVDILLTVSGLEGQRPGRPATTTLMGGLEVLAVGEDRPSDGEGGGELRQIVVAATPEEAARLILAQNCGRLSVTLCDRIAPRDALRHTDDCPQLVGYHDLLCLAPLEPDSRSEPPRETKPTLRKKSEVWPGAQLKAVDREEPGARATRSTETAAAPTPASTAASELAAPRPTLAPRVHSAGRATGRVIEIQVEAQQGPAASDGTRR